MISEPTVIVECDACGHTEEHGIHPLASRSWDLRYLERRLERAGWRVDDECDFHLCPDCVAAQEAEDDTPRD